MCEHPGISPVGRPGCTPDRRQTFSGLQRPVETPVPGGPVVLLRSPVVDACPASLPPPRPPQHARLATRVEPHGPVGVGRKNDDRVVMSLHLGGISHILECNNTLIYITD